VKSVTTKELAEVLKIGERRIQQLAKDGVLMRSDDGNFNLPDSIENYYVNKFESDKIDFDHEHALLEKAKREKAELDLDVFKKTLLYADDMEHLMSGMIITFKARLLSLPTKCAPLILGKKSMAEVVEILKDAVYEALNELKEIPAAKVVEAGDADDG
jgi:hypothetical protein